MTKESVYHLKLKTDASTELHPHDVQKTHNLRKLAPSKLNDSTVLTKGEQALLMFPLPFGSFTRLKLSVNQSPTA